MHRLRRHLRFAFQPGDDGSRLAVQRHAQLTLLVGHRRRRQYAVSGEMAHQLQVERQLFEAEVFKDGEHELAALGCQEKIAVLDAGRDTFQREGFAKGELRHPMADIFQCDRGKNCHEKPG
jgi:hypothetical protein